MNGPNLWQLVFFMIFLAWSISFERKPVPRKLMMPYALIEGKTTKIGAISIPQIDAPRMVINNFPKPSYHFQQYPQAHLANSENVPAPLSVFAPFEVPISKVGDLQGATCEEGPEKEKQGKLVARKLKNQPKNRHQISRKLNQPYLNTGPGFFDVGNIGYSALSHALINPKMTSMGPFVPRGKPPVPFRIRLRNFDKENYESGLLSITEMRVHEQQTKKLQEILIDEVGKLTENYGSVKDVIGKQIGLLVLSAEKRDEQARKVNGQIFQKSVNDLEIKKLVELKKQKQFNDELENLVENIPKIERRLNSTEKKRKSGYKIKEGEYNDRVALVGQSQTDFTPKIPKKFGKFI